MQNKKKLTPWVDDNDAVVEELVEKAANAYARWMDVLRKNDIKERATAIVAAACESEYEATVQCIELLVAETTENIHVVTIDRALGKLSR